MKVWLSLFLHSALVAAIAQLYTRERRFKIDYNSTCIIYSRDRALRRFKMDTSVCVNTRVRGLNPIDSAL